jgi:hypothetical protein
LLNADRQNADVDVKQGRGVSQCSPAAFQGDWIGTKVTDVFGNVGRIAFKYKFAFRSDHVYTYSIQVDDPGNPPRMLNWTEHQGTFEIEYDFESAHDPRRRDHDGGIGDCRITLTPRKDTIRTYINRQELVVAASSEGLLQFEPITRTVLLLQRNMTPARGASVFALDFYGDIGAVLSRSFYLYRP